MVSNSPCSCWLVYKFCWDLCSHYKQKIQKMHPMMYGDHFGTIYKFRDRIRSKAMPSPVKWLSLGQAGSESLSSGTQSNLETSLSTCMARTDGNVDGNGNGNGTYDSSTTDSPFCMHVLPKVLVGPQFQAKVPEWDGVISGTDSKWLGTHMWLLEKKEHWSLIERDPIGKGRHDSCGCRHQGSVECERFHIAEKRMKLKLELGSAFHRMKVDIKWVRRWNFLVQMKNRIDLLPSCSPIPCHRISASGSRCSKSSAIRAGRSWLATTSVYFF